jgi:hypothetical protein
MRGRWEASTNWTEGSGRDQEGKARMQCCLEKEKKRKEKRLSRWEVFGNLEDLPAHVTVAFPLLTTLAKLTECS